MNEEVKKILMGNPNPTPLEALKKCEWNLGENGWLKYRRKDLEIIRHALNQAEENEKELQSYKKIEEELGIDLGTLLKALNNGIYVYSKLDECVCHVHVRLNFNGTQWLLISDDFAIFPKKLTNYRKTWALTKEELKRK